MKDASDENPDIDLLANLSSLGYQEEREIPENHMIIGVYGSKRHPKGNPRRITSLGFVLMDISAL